MGQHIESMNLIKAHKKKSPLGLFNKRVTRIELATAAWKAEVLPLNYTRKVNSLTYKKNGPDGI